MGEGVFLTDDKWVIQHGHLDPTDEEIMKQIAQGGPALTVMSLEQLLEKMQKEEPQKFEQFKDEFTKRLPSFKNSKEIVRLTPLEIVRMAKQADERLDEFDKVFGLFLSEKAAPQIRRWRVDDHYTWRSIARAVYGTAIWCNWNPPSNQLAGMSLCKAAAKLLGESWLSDPWN